MMGVWVPRRLLGQRGQRGLPWWARWTPVSLARWVAQRRRDAGWYDKRTLALFRLSWVRGRTAAAMLGLVVYKRDLGLPLAPRYAPLLAQVLARLSRRQLRIALALLDEVGREPAGPVAGVLSGAVRTAVRDGQAAWRAEFESWLRRQAPGGVCVVGNGSNLLGAGLGAAIDGKGVVVRFNLFRGVNSSPTDIGERVTVWVAAPDFGGVAPSGVSWVCVSGPDVSFRMQDWRRFEEPLRAGAKVLTIPLEPWRDLVRRVQAPPSAGLLFLAWARRVLGSWAHVHAVGFGGVAGGRAPYHHADAGHAPASRHHWPAERDLLHRWQQEGLHIEPRV